MAQIDTENQELLTKNESGIPSMESSDTKEGEGKNASSNKDKTSEPKEYRKKKQDALEGREEKETKGREESEREDSSHHSADKAEAEDTTSHSRQGLQSGQTTVQFSSGGSMSATLTSLLGLFASSANLVRAETGSMLAVASQNANLNLKSGYHAATNQLLNLSNEEGRIIKGAITTLAEESSESSSNKFIADLGGISTTHSASGSQELLMGILKGVSAQATEVGTDTGGTSIVPYISTGIGIAFIQVFNPNNFFFTPGTQFTFTSQPQSYASSIVISKYISEAGLPATGPYAFQVISPTSTTAGANNGIYTNGVIFEQPQTGSLNLTSLAGTTDKNGNFQFPSALSGLNGQLGPLQLPGQESSTYGLALSPSGSLLVDVTQPMSVLINVYTGGNTSAVPLPVRIDAAPMDVFNGQTINNLVSAPNGLGDFASTSNNLPSTYINNTMKGLISPDGTNFINTLFVDDPQLYANPTPNAAIVGNATAIMLNSSQFINANNLIPENTTGGNLIFPVGIVSGQGILIYEMNLVPSNGVVTYSFPSSTIFRHIGNAIPGTDTTTTTDPTDNNTTPVPTEAAYGNFSIFTDYNVDGNPVTDSTFTLLNSNGYNLTLGGNVLDVYGTKYGVGDVLNVYLPQSLSTTNTIQMGGNTLAGFGTAYGDLGKLFIGGSPGVNSQASSGGSLTIEFRGNIDYVDKGIASILFPHLQELDLSKNLSTTSHITLQFDNSIITGNTANNIFYGDTQNLGDLGDSSLYSGFITGVKASLVNGHVVIHDALLNNDGTYTNGNNEIIFSNSIYTGGRTPLNPNGVNTYHFTLVGDQNNLPVMEGNAIITDFNPIKDVLDFQITPALFKAFDYNSDKTFSALGLDIGTAVDGKHYPNVVFHQNQTIVDPNTGATLGVGTVIDFLGGGSLSLIYQPGFSPISSFQDLPPQNLTQEVNLSYQPISALPVVPSPATYTPQIGLNSLIDPLVYGMGPQLTSEGPYNNALDSFFKNSLFAVYTVQSPGDVTIDQYGTINVMSQTPYFRELTITGETTNPIPNSTPQSTSDHSTLLFGFFDAAITQDFSNMATLIGGQELGYTKPPTNLIGNILEGGTNALIVGGIQQSWTVTQSTLNLTLSSLNNGSFGIAALIDDPYAGTTSYGNFQQLTIGNTNDSEIIAGRTFNTSTIASYVNGTSYGIGQDITININGVSKATLTLTSATTSADPFVQNNIGEFGGNSLNGTTSLTSGPILDGNNFNFPTESMYGSGTIIGDLQSITVVAKAGTGASIVNNVTPASNTYGVLNTSALFIGNTYNFDSTDLNVHGDKSSDTTNVYSNLKSLDITAVTDYHRNESLHTIINSDAVIANNQLIFQNDTATGGNGATNFYGHVQNLGDPFGFSAANNPTPNAYLGFVTGVSVSNDANNNKHILITDIHGNSISYGDNTYTGGTGANTYYYTIVEDMNGRPVMQGHDTINNFDPSKDSIVFDIESNLFSKLGMGADLSTNINILNGFVSVLNGVIQFEGPSNEDYGSITLIGNNPNNTGNLDKAGQLSDFNSLHSAINVVQFGTAYQAPTLVTPAPAFDPVFVQSVQEQAFLSFVNDQPSLLKWSLLNGATSAPDPNQPNITDYSYSSAPGLVLDSTGTLSIFPTTGNATGAEVANFQIQATDGTTPLTLNPMLIFGINATDDYIHRDTGADKFTYTNNTITGNQVFQNYTPSVSLAFETTTPGNTVIGGSTSIIYDPSKTPTTSPLNPPYDTYGSNLIYDVSTSTTNSVTTGHTAIGSVQDIGYTNDGANSITGDGVNFIIDTSLTNFHETKLDLTFNSNVFDVNAFDSNAATNGRGVYGDSKTLTFSAAGTVTSVSTKTITSLNTVVNDYIDHNTLTFNSNTEYGSGNLFGNIGTVKFEITDPTIINYTNGLTPPPTVGNGYIESNTLTFNANNLTSLPVSPTLAGSATLDASIGTLIMDINVTNANPHDGTSAISGNIFNFGDSNETGGSRILTTFNEDIADVSQTDLANQPVTVTTNNSHVQITDSQGNIFNLGNDHYTGSATGSSIYKVTVLNTFTYDPTTQLSTFNPVGFGNLAVTTGTSTDQFVFNVTPTLYDMLQGVSEIYNRTIASKDLNNLVTIPAANPNPSGTTFNFSAGGSLWVTNESVLQLSDIGSVGASLIYNPATVTAISDPQPLVVSPFLGTYGNTDGVYGLILDTYFNNVDVASTGSTYSVSDILPFSNTLYNELDGNVLPVLALPQSLTFSSDNFGTITAKISTNLATYPLLVPELITANDAHNAGNHPTITLMIGEFNTHSGSYVFDTGLTPDATTGITTFTGSATQSSYLKGIANNEIMVGNIDPSTHDVNLGLTIDDSYSVKGVVTYGGIQYQGDDLFGGNILTNFSPNTVAYGDFENINVTFAGTKGILGLAMQFGQNAIAVNGSTYGIADNFNLSLGTSTQNDTFIFGFSSTPTSPQGNYGWETIYGQGTIHGVLNTLDVFKSQALTTVQLNYDFAGSEVVIMNPQDNSIAPLYSTVFSNLDRWIFNLDISTLTGNSFMDTNFGDVLIIGGSGGGNYYPSVNDMSETPFWYNQVQDNAYNASSIPSSSTFENYTVTWGLHKVVLNGGNNIINIDLLDAGNVQGNALNIAHAPTPTGSYEIVNFNQAHDIIRFNISQPLYNYALSQAQANGLGLTSSLLYDDFLSSQGNHAVTVSGNEISFFGGLETNISGTDNSALAAVLMLDGLTINNFDTFATSNIQIGTTFDGTLNNYANGESNITVVVPRLGNFQEYDQVSDFKLDSNHILVAESPVTYNNSLTGILTTTDANSLLAMSDLLNANATTAASGITVNVTPAQFSSSDGVTVDTNLNFETNGNTTGSILLHNVSATATSNNTTTTSIANLGNNFELGQYGSGGNTTYTFVIPGNSLNNLTSFNIDTFIMSDPAHPTQSPLGSLQFILTPSTYAALSSDNTLNGTIGAAELTAHSGDSIGGFVLTSTTIDGVNHNYLTVETNANTPNQAIYGQIDIMNAPIITDLSAISLKVGYVEAGSLGNANSSGDIFTYNMVGTSDGNGGTTYSFTNFTQFDHIVNFDDAKDMIQIAAPAQLYYQVNPEGILSTSQLLNALQNGTNSVGNIYLSESAPQYYSSSPDVDTILNFASKNNAIPTGEITIHNDSNFSLWNNSTTNFQFISTQDISHATNKTLSFNANPSHNADTASILDMSSFGQLAHVTHYSNSGSDIIQIELPLSLYTAIYNSVETSTSTTGPSSLQIEAALKAGVTTGNGVNSITNQISEVISNGSTILDFNTTHSSVTTTWGSITLDGVTNISSLTSFGNHLEFGSIQQGSLNGANSGNPQSFTFEAFNANATLGDANGTQPGDLSAFTEFSHIIDFNNGASGDNLTIDISKALYQTIYNDLYPDPVSQLTHQTATNQELIQALDTGSANGQSLGTQIVVTESPTAQYTTTNGAAVDTILSFVTNGHTSGTVTLHNVDLQGHLTNLSHLTIAHA